MLNLLSDEDGLDYIFARMSAIYGATFSRHWDGIDPTLIRQEWKYQLGHFLTYKPSLDYAIDRLDGDFIPSAIKFREFCNAGPSIPRDEPQITYNPTPVYKPPPVDPAIVAEAKRKLKDIINKIRS